MPLKKENLDNTLVDIRQNFDRVLQLTELPPFDEFQEIAHFLFNNCKEAIEVIEANKNEDPEICKQIAINWMPEVLDYVILLRDIAFRLYRDEQYLQDGKTNPEQVNKYNQETIDVLHTATNEIITDYETCTTDTSKYQWDKIKHYASPAKEIISQIKVCDDQLTLMVQAKIAIKQLRAEIKGIKGKVFEECNDQEKFLEDQHKYAEEALQFISTKIASEDPEEVIKIGVLNKIVQKIDFEKLDTNYNDLLTAKKGVVKIPFKVEDTELYIKETDLGQETNNWLEDRIIPVLRDRAAVSSQVRNNFEAKLFNGYNRLQLLKEDISDYKKQLESLYLSIKDEQDILAKTLDETKSKFVSLKSELRSTLTPTALYNEEQIYLPLYNPPVSESLQQNGSRLVTLLNVDKWKESWYKNVNRLWINPNMLQGDREDLISYISDKDISRLNRYDQALFFNKGYLGKTFTVERDDFNDKFVKAYEDWKKGFAGSLLIHGERLSGKTTLLESVQLRVKEKCIVLKPGEEWNLLGAKQPPSFNLDPIFSQIGERAIGSSMIVLIDDLELWRDSETYLLQNVERLISFMNRYQRNVFFVVVTNTFIKKKMDPQVKFSDQFAYHYIANQMPIEKVVDAINIRQNALVRNVEGANESKAEGKTEKVARKLARKNHGNIGMSLIEWANYHKSDYTFSDRRKIFKQFEDLVKDHTQILSYLLQFKSTTEQELSKLIPSELMENYRNSIRVLLTYKLIERNPTGKLGINEVIVHDVEDILSNRKHLFN